jgi:hypothetical protein
MTTVSDVTTLGMNDYTGDTELTLEGYHSPNDGGGGVLVLDATAVGADNGLVFADGATPTPNYFRRLNPTGDVREWGAFCDAVIETTHGNNGTSGGSTFTAHTALDAKYNGANIVIVGAGAAGAPLVTTIAGLSGTTVTLATNIVTTFPTYLATGVSSVVTGGTGYAPGDQCTMSDGSIVLVSAVSSGVVTSVALYAQGSPQNSVPGTLTQVPGGPGDGMLTCNLSYSATGQFAYGHDDTAAITGAINAAIDGGYAVHLPPGTISGVTSPITLPTGSTILEGSDLWTTGIVALNTMTSPSCVIEFPGSGFGGGASGFFVDAFKLADSAIQVTNARGAVFRSVQARNGIIYDWFCGSGPSGASAYFEYCDGRTSCKTFAPVSQLSTNNWYFAASEGTRLIACSADGCSQASFKCDGGGIYLMTCNFFGGPAYCFCPDYCFDMNSPTLITGCQAGSPKTAGYHVASGQVNMSNNYIQFGAPSYADPVTTFGVVIEAMGTPYFTKDCIVLGTMDDNSITGENMVVQMGIADPTTVVANNARATYTTVDPYVVWAQPATNAYANKAARLGAPPMGNARFVLVDDMLAAIGPAILAKADMFYVLAGADEVTALLNIAAPGIYTLVKNGSVTFTADRGYAGDGSTGYLDTAVTLNHLVHFIQNDASLFAWTGDNQSTNGSFAIGTASTNSRSRINPRDGSGNLSVRAQSTTDDTAADGDSIGMYGWSRHGGGYNLYVDGASVGTPATGTAVPNSSFRLLADGTNFSTRTIQAAWIGAGLTGGEVTQLYNAVKTYLTAVGAPT